MDDAHKKRMRLMNQPHGQRAAGDGKTDLRKTLKAVADFTIRHFREEEAFMQSVGFPGIESHKRIHAKLLAWLNDHVNAFEKSADGLPNQFFDFLKVWLTAHVPGIDTKYAQPTRGRR